MKAALLLASSLLFAGFAPQKGLIISDTEVVCTINRATSIDQLKEFKSRLWNERKITFDITQYEMDGNNQLINFSFAVDCHDGFKGAAKRTFFTNRTRIGFYRSYLPTAKVPFAIGKMPFRK